MANNSHCQVLWRFIAIPELLMTPMRSERGRCAQYNGVDCPRPASILTPHLLSMPFCIIHNSRP